MRIFILLDFFHYLARSHFNGIDAKATVDVNAQDVGQLSVIFFLMSILPQISTLELLKVEHSLFVGRHTLLDMAQWVDAFLEPFEIGKDAKGYQCDAQQPCPPVFAHDIGYEVKKLGRDSDNGLEVLYGSNGVYNNGIDCQSERLALGSVFAHEIGHGWQLIGAGVKGLQSDVTLDLDAVVVKTGSVVLAGIGDFHFGGDGFLVDVQ